MRLCFVAFVALISVIEISTKIPSTEDEGSYRHVRHPVLLLLCGILEVDSGTNTA